MHISAPALSRAIRLLEDELGHELFTRKGRGIELNERGQVLLTAVRDGMRLIHEGMLGVLGNQLSGVVRVSSQGLITTAYVLPAIRQVHREHPELRPELRSHSLREIVAMLLSGELDVAFTSTKTVHERLQTEHLGTETSGVYCGRGHPLFEYENPSSEELCRHDFVAPIADEYGEPGEGWPPSLTRRIALHVDQMRIGIDACASGEYLAVLPDVLAAQHGNALRRLPLEITAKIELYAVRREALGPSGRAEAIVEAVRAQIAGR